MRHTVTSTGYINYYRPRGRQNGEGTSSSSLHRPRHPATAHRGPETKHRIANKRVNKNRKRRRGLAASLTSLRNFSRASERQSSDALMRGTRPLSFALTHHIRYMFNDLLSCSLGTTLSTSPPLLTVNFLQLPVHDSSVTTTTVQWLVPERMTLFA